MSAILAKIESSGYLLVSFSRWILLLIIGLLPWLEGGVHPETVRQFVFWAHLCGGIWMLGLLFRLKLPGIPWPLVLACLTLLGLGWFSVFNARYIYDPGFYQFTAVHRPFPDAPGSWSVHSSVHSLWILQALIITLFILTDACRRSLWRQRCLLGLLFSGGLLAAYGLFQIVFRAPSIYWLDWNSGSTFFASFRYHGNAGAFLNLCWPLALVTLFSQPQDDASEIRKKAACWFFVLISCGLLINVSRAALGIGALVMAGFSLFLVFSSYRHRLLQLGRWLRLMISFVLVAVALIASAGLLLPSTMRWERWSNQEFAFDESRSIVFEICGNMIRQEPWFGHGPGTFATLFPFSSGPLGNLIPGVWRYAHNDYLQTLVEWGAVGLVLFLIVFLGAAIRIFSKSFLRTELSGREDLLLCYGCCASLLTVLLHASVDFPLQILSIQTWVVVLLALCWSRNTSEKNN